MRIVFAFLCLVLLVVGMCLNIVALRHITSNFGDTVKWSPFSPKTWGSQRKIKPWLTQKGYRLYDIGIALIILGSLLYLVTTFLSHQ